MSTARRAYDLLRGYINNEIDRLKDLELWDAMRELDGPSREEMELATPSEPTPSVPATPLDKKTLARQILGVAEAADFGEIRKAFERLNKRSDPANFPANSPEQRRAADLQKRVTWAYLQLSEGVSDTEKRFRTLEID